MCLPFDVFKSFSGIIEYTSKVIQIGWAVRVVELGSTDIGRLFSLNVYGEGGWNEVQQQDLPLVSKSEALRGPC